jgi:hypothetical protein
VLLGVFASEEIALRQRLHFVAENGRMTGVRDEVVQRWVVGQESGIGSGHVQQDHQRARRQLLLNRRQD